MIRGEEELDIVENMIRDWPTIVNTIELVVYDKGKYKGFCISYKAGDYLVQHEAGLGGRLGKVEGVVVLKPALSKVLVDSIVVCFPTRVLRYWSSAFLVDPYKIRDSVSEGLTHQEAILKDMNRATSSFLENPESITSTLRYRRETDGCDSCRNIVVSGGLPSLGKRR